MKKLITFLLIIQTVVLIYFSFVMVKWVGEIDTRLYSFEGYFFAPYDTDYNATNLIMEHLKEKDRKRIQKLRKLK